MKIDTRSPAFVIQCLAGDLLADPAEILELIKADSRLKMYLKANLDGAMLYENLLEKVSEQC